MPDLTAKRTLVKSPPELWEELSEVEGLSKHFGAFGEIKITKLEPEHTVAWEGEHASGTVSIEPSGWGTKVTLHAELPDEQGAQDEEPTAEAPTDAAEPEPEAVEEPEPVAEASEQVAADPEPVPQAPGKRGFWAWLFRSRTAPPEPVEPEAQEPEPVVEEPMVEQPAADAPVVEEPVAEEPVAEQPEPEPVDEEPEREVEEPQAEGLDPERARAVLDHALDALGAAHHRPFSRG